MSEIHSRHILLITTVGGAPEPLVASIEQWRPAKVLFVPSSETADKVGRIRDLLKQHGHDLREGEYETIPVSDPQNFSRCVHEMRNGLEGYVTGWCERGDDYDCVADFTGGTKCMSAALALVARPWPAVQFSYVGGTRRDKDDVGIVVSGKEQVARAANPWDALGYQAVEDAVAAFDRLAYGWGAQRLRNALPYVVDQKSELSVLATFMEAYALWDRSEYGQAFDSFVQCAKRLNDLSAALPGAARDRLRRHIEHARTRLEKLKQGSDCPTRELLDDLIANAARRREEGRHVDAVARLYRAVEAAAQLRLWERYKINTGKILLEAVPGSMRDRLEPQAVDGRLKLGLQDAYEVLLRMEDPLGERFAGLGWNSAKSPLSKRNDSIAGHGFKTVSPEISDKLWEGALSLAGLSEGEVFQFPKLGST